MRAVFLSFLLSTVALGDPAPLTTVSDACTSRESWTFAEDIAPTLPAVLRETFVQSLQPEFPSFQGFAAAQTIAGSGWPIAAAFSKYWTARSFWKAGLHRLAAPMFNEMADDFPSEPFLPLQLAAIDCLNRIHEVSPAPLFTEGTLARLPHYLKHPRVQPEQRSILWTAALHGFMRELLNGEVPKKRKLALAVFEESGVYEDFAVAIEALSRGELLKEPLNRFLSADELPDPLKTYRSELAVLAANVWYGEGNYDAALTALRRVDPRSSAHISALALRSWIALDRQDVGEAASLLAQSQVGAHTGPFLPEVPVVAGATLLDICQFPRARRAVQHFKRKYQPATKWFDRFEGKFEGIRLYSRAVDFLNGDAIDTPRLLAVEWIRSPLFRNYQQAINDSFQESRLIPELITQFEDHIAAVRYEISVIVDQADDELLNAAAEATAGDPEARSPASLSSKVIEMKDFAVAYDRLIEAFPKWKAALEGYREAGPAFRERLSGRLEAYLRDLTRRMHQRLVEATADAEVLEAEVLEGASRDIVRQADKLGQALHGAGEGKEPEALQDLCPKRKKKR